MITNVEFEEIRPYIGTEVSAAIQRIVKYDLFFDVLQYFFPEISRAEMKSLVKDIHTTYDFQRQIMHTGIRRMINTSSKGLTYTGFERIDPDKAYVYISNHRDIFLDSGILQVLLVEHEIDTTQITFGSNLMQLPLITDLGKINKMFTVFRGGSRREQYEHAKRLSAYIRQVISLEKESVWIAQRSGRTKDGNDQTQVGLVNMLLASDRKDFVGSLSRLNIVPMAISYEYEPCDYLKVQELYDSIDKTYIKKSGEDLQSIIAGVVEPKGHIHLALGKPIEEAHLQEIYDNYDKQDRCRQLAQSIDREIYTHYKLWPTNYIAADMHSGQTKYTDHYSREEYQNFDAYIKQRLQRLTGDQEIMRQMFLEMYANPVYNRP